MNNPLKSGAGGTKGGLGTFFLGLLMALVGGYLLLNQIKVGSGLMGQRWRLFGEMDVSSFGITAIVFMLGVAMLFMNGRSVVGWVLSGGSLLLSVVGVIASLKVTFADTSLYVLLVMLVLLCGGIGLMMRALKPFGEPSSG